VSVGCGHRLVFDTPGNDEELAFVEFNDPVTEMYRQVPAKDQKQLVLALVMVPDEFAFELRELDMLTVELTDNTRAPAFRELMEFLGEVHFIVLAVAHTGFPDTSAHRTAANDVDSRTRAARGETDYDPFCTMLQTQPHAVSSSSAPGIPGVPVYIETPICKSATLCGPSAPPIVKINTPPGCTPSQSFHRTPSR